MNLNLNKSHNLTSIKDNNHKITLALFANFIDFVYNLKGVFWGKKRVKKGHKKCSKKVHDIENVYTFLSIYFPFFCNALIINTLQRHVVTPTGFKPVTLRAEI